MPPPVYLTSYRVSFSLCSQAKRAARRRRRALAAPLTGRAPIRKLPRESPPVRALLLPKLLPAAAARSPRRASDPTRTQPIGPCARCSNGRARGGRSSPSRATPRPSGPLHIVETARAAPRIPASRPGHRCLARPSPDTTRAPPIAPAALPLRRPPTPPAPPAPRPPPRLGHAPSSAALRPRAPVVPSLAIPPPASPPVAPAARRPDDSRRAPTRAPV